MEEVKESKGFAIASLVLGIIGLLCCCFGWIGMIFQVLALVFGIIVLVKKKAGRGMAIAGIICGGIGLVVAIIFTVVGASMANSLVNDSGLYTFNGYTTNDPVDLIQHIIESAQ